MPRPLRHAFAVRRPTTDVQWTGFLDMLRYDQATVLEHHRDLVILATPPNRDFTTPRWASFGLHVLASEVLSPAGASADLLAGARRCLPPPAARKMVNR